MFGFLQKMTVKENYQNANFLSVQPYAYTMYMTCVYTPKEADVPKNWAEFIWIIWDQK